MKYPFRTVLTLILLVAAIVTAVVWRTSREKPAGYLDEFAKCLGDKKVTMYGAAWCSHCQNEKKAFGSSFSYVPYVECPADPKACIDKGIEGYPTWIFPASPGGTESRKFIGEQGLKKLSIESGCALPVDKQP